MFVSWFILLPSVYINNLLNLISNAYAHHVWYADGHGFDPHVQQIFFRGDLVMKNISTAILSLLLIKKDSCQLLAKEWALSTGKLLEACSGTVWIG